MGNNKANTADAVLTVLDAGARYGIHPTWKGFPAPLNYIMFEPDQDEAARLKKHYGKTRPDVCVENFALGEQPGTLPIHVYRHHGQSSHYLPNADNLWFAVARKGEGDIVDTYDAKMVTVDDYADEHGICFDFMKLDTEGHELSILKGAEKQLADHVLGVRAEVHFDSVLHGIPLFPQVHDFFITRGFRLLNMDYRGQGQHMNGFVDGDRYGVLLGTDAIWVKKMEDLGDSDVSRGTLRCMKYAAYCMNNFATDVAMAALLKGRDEWGYDYAPLSDTPLYKGLDVSVQQLFKRLQDRPGQDLEVLETTYHKLFARNLKSMHDFYESREINPLS